MPLISREDFLACGAMTMAHSRAPPRRLAHGRCLLFAILAVVACDLLTPCIGLTWDRAASPPPLLAYHSSLLITLSSGNLFADTVLDNFGQDTPVVTTSLSLDKCPPAADPDDTSLIITMGGVDSVNNNQNGVYILPWPMSASRSGQQRWLTAPLVGMQPTARDSFGLVASAADSRVAGRAYIFGGATATRFLSSLWVLNLETTVWAPLGPSKLVDASNPTSLRCPGKETYFHDKGATLPVTDGTEGTIDECSYFTNTTAPQVDEFGCPWPAPRQSHSMVVIGDAIYVFAGMLISWPPLGDVWRLKINGALRDAELQQSASVAGEYVYNANQLRWLKNPKDPKINKSVLCPVRWELLTRPGTASLLNQSPNAPFPEARIVHSAAVSGSAMWIVGGARVWGKTARSDVLGDVWVLETTTLAWTRIEPTLPSTSYNPAARVAHSSFAMYLDRIDKYVMNTTDEHIVACASHRTSALMISANGADAESSTWLLLPPCSDTIAPGTADFTCSTSPPLNASSVGWSWQRVLTASKASAEPQAPYAGSFVQLPDQRLLIVGGLDKENALAKSTMLLDLRAHTAVSLPQPYTGMQLSSQKPALAIPGPFTRHLSFLIDRRLWVLGAKIDRLDEMWTYDVDRFTWSKLSRSSAVDTLPKPADVIWPMVESAASATNGTHLIIYAGTNEENPTLTCTNLLYAFDIAKLLWFNLTAKVRSGTPWSDTAEAALATGGEVIDGFIYPLPRCWSRAVVIGHGRKLIMFGGDISTSAYYSSPSDNALWELDLHTLTWTLLQRSLKIGDGLDDPTASQPGARKGHNMVAIGSDHLAVLFGMDRTLSTTGYSSAAWIYGRSSNRWRMINDGTLTVSGIGALAGRIRSSVTLSQGTVLVALGGLPFVGAVLEDMWGMDLSIEPPKWTQMYAASSLPPAARDRASFHALDDEHEALYYGGIESDLSVHVLSFDTATAGGAISIEHLPHDFLAGMSFSRGAIVLEFAEVAPTTPTTAGPPLDPDQGGPGPIEGDPPLASPETTEVGVPVDPVIFYMDSSTTGGGEEDPNTSLVVPVGPSEPVLDITPDFTIVVIDVPDVDVGPVVDPTPSTVLHRVVPRAGSFATLAAAIRHFQSPLVATSAVLTVLDTEDSYTVRTTLGLHLVHVHSNLTIRGPPNINKRAVLDCGNRPSCSLTIDMSSSDSSSACTQRGNALVILRDLVLRNGFSPTKGGALSIINSQVYLENVWLEKSSAATFGGALSIQNGRVRMVRCTVRNNQAQLSGGGGFIINSQVSFRQCNFTDNSIGAATNTSSYHAYGQGGAVGLMSADVLVEDSLFLRNRGRNGGAIAASPVVSWIPNADEAVGMRLTLVVVRRSRFELNVATDNGGAVFLSRLGPDDGIATTSVTIPSFEQSIFNSNRAGASGGAVYLDYAQVISTATIYSANECGIAGGAVFWSPSKLDESNRFEPVFNFSGLTPPAPQDCAAFRTAATTSSGLTFPSERLDDAWCNAATYGPFKAAPAASMEFSRSSNTILAAATQSSGVLVSNPLSLYLVDNFGQPVLTDDSTFVSVGPSTSLGGPTSVQVTQGEAVFDSLLYRAPPGSTVNLTFIASVPLVFLSRDADKLKLQLTSNHVAPSGLLATSNTTFAHQGDCSKICTYNLPTVSGAQTTLLRLVFQLDRFRHDTDRVTIAMTRASSQQTYTTITGAQIAAHTGSSIQAESVPTAMKYARFLAAQTPYASSTLAVDLEIPSGSVVFQLQTYDDLTGYVSGNFSFSSDCPDGLRLDPGANECLAVTQSSSMVRGITIAVAGLAGAGILVAIGLLAWYRHFPLFRAASVSLSAAILGLLTLLPVAGIFFALVPEEGTNWICIARVWFGSLPVIGVLAILASKAHRVVAIARSSTLKPANIKDSHMWLFVAACLLLQVIICMPFSLYPLSRSVLRRQSLSNAIDQQLVQQCSMEDGFAAWFGVQLAYVATLCIGAGYLSFQARGVSSKYGESSHVANALFMLVIVGGILVPVAVLVQDSPDPIVVIQGMGCSFVALMWTGVLFLPKFISVRRTQRQAKVLERQQLQARAQAKITAAAMRAPAVAPVTAGSSPPGPNGRGTLLSPNYTPEDGRKTKTPKVPTQSPSPLTCAVEVEVGGEDQQISSPTGARPRVTFHIADEEIQAAPAAGFDTQDEFANYVYEADPVGDLSVGRMVDNTSPLPPIQPTASDHPASMVAHSLLFGADYNRVRLLQAQPIPQHYFPQDHSPIFDSPTDSFSSDLREAVDANDARALAGLGGVQSQSNLPMSLSSSLPAAIRRGPEFLDRDDPVHQHVSFSFNGVNLSAIGSEPSMSLGVTSFAAHGLYAHAPVPAVGVVESTPSPEFMLQSVDRNIVPPRPRLPMRTEIRVIGDR